MKRILQVSFFVACLAMVGANQKPRVLCEGFLQENNFKIPVGFVDGGITEAQWTALFDKYEKIYTPIIASRGGKLVLNRLWTDETVNANANQPGDGTWVINMFGGLARYPTMTVDAMTLVVCHETGHHLGGAPKYYSDPTEWAATEGGADYFATLKCAHHMFGDDDNVSIVSKMTIDPSVKASCDSQYTDANESALCQRSTSAGIILGQLLADLLGEPKPEITTPSTEVVANTNDDGYATTQCRMDTYYNASLCTADVAIFQDGDYHTGTCTAPAYRQGLRPACWFKADAKDSVAQ